MWLIECAVYLYFLSTKPNTYNFEMSGPRKVPILRSVDKTTKYTDNMKEFLESQKVDLSDDTFIQHYSTTATTTSKIKIHPCYDKAKPVENFSVPESTTCIRRSAVSQISLSDRPILCMASHGNSLACGSADHGIYEVTVAGDKLILNRNLYTKKYGHSEWVSALEYLPDGRLVSGGMDSKICVWNSKSVLCQDLNGHAGSISKVRCAENRIISSSYDRTLRIWDVGNLKIKELGKLSGHKGAVLDFIWNGGLKVVSAGRDGTIRLWDLGGSNDSIAITAHTGHVTAIDRLSENTVVTGGQDSKVRFWDCRTGKIMISISSAHTAGAAVNCVHAINDSSIVSTGADGRIALSDLRHDKKVVGFWQWPETRFIYSSELLNSNLVLAANESGAVTLWNLQTCLPQSTIKVFENAIRCISILKNRQIALCGDDGNLCLLDTD